MDISEVNRSSLLINRNRSASAFEKVITTNRNTVTLYQTKQKTFLHCKD